MISLLSSSSLNKYKKYSVKDSVLGSAAAGAIGGACLQGVFGSVALVAKRTSPKALGKSVGYCAALSAIGSALLSLITTTYHNHRADKEMKKLDSFY